ncbi:MAG TPA: hypothetical protein VFD66_06180 [Verrucomicrobiae bacterium]|nr:hypothetical protein [Verrucomicrobiae bacterium]
MATPAVGIFMTFDPSWLIGSWSFLVLIFAFQAAGIRKRSLTHSRPAAVRWRNHHANTCFSA